MLGYVGMDDEGLGGLEREFDDDLRGIPGQELISVDARRKWFSRVERPPDPGQNLVLTIDRRSSTSPRKSWSRECRTRRRLRERSWWRIRAPAKFWRWPTGPHSIPTSLTACRTRSLKNRAVSDVYEPGSVFKIVTYSAAIDQHVVTPDDHVDCQHGSIDVFGMKIHDHESLGVITIAEALAHSSDVAAIKVGMKLGDQRLYHYIKDYGFGQQTGIELPGETRGLAKPVNRWSKVSIGAISMGQEIGVTPLQTISLISTIANDGVYTPPRIVAGELPPDSKALPVVFHPAQQHRVVTPMTAVQMKKMMEGVVLEGTARRAILDGYTVAGKTGTAQKVDPATGAYSKTKYVASFIGFSPVNNPAITIAVILDSPVGLHQGGQVCAPVFKRIAQQVLEYLHVPHDLEVKNPLREKLLASAKDSDVDESSERLGDPALEENPTVPVQAAASSASHNVGAVTPPAISTPPAGSAPVEPAQTAVSLQPSSGSAVTPANGTVVVAVDTGTVVPSFVGKPLRAAVEIAQQSGLEIDAVGSGVAREQWPTAGSRLTAGQKITVRFAH